jgi:hypothetical protein
LISLERLDELQFCRGEAVTSDELIELVHAHRLTQRLRRNLEALRNRIDGNLRDLRDIHDPVVEPIILDEECEGV